MTATYIPTEAEKALKERDRQYRQYQRHKREEYTALFARPVYGERLRKFHKTLGHFGAKDPPRLLAYVRKESFEWLGGAPYEIRLAALHLINTRITRLRLRAGKAPFDDPLWDQPDNPFRLCKQELGL